MKLYMDSILKFNDENLLNRAISGLSPARREKALRYKDKDSLKACVLGELLIRKMLDELGITNDISYGFKEHGKPYLKGMDDVHFNISHSKDMVICVADNKEIGCDIQHTTDMDYINIAKRFLHEEEVESVCSLKEANLQKDEFYRIWVLKESYVKMTGMGLIQDFNSFSVMNALKDGLPGCRFIEYNDLPGYRYAVCYSE